MALPPADDHRHSGRRVQTRTLNQIRQLLTSHPVSKASENYMLREPMQGRGSADHPHSSPRLPSCAQKSPIPHLSARAELASQSPRLGATLSNSDENNRARSTRLLWQVHY